MKLTKQKLLIDQIKRRLDYSSVISSGIACHALTFLHKAGVLDDMANDGEFDMRMHGYEEDISNIPAIHAAFLSLRQIGAVTAEKSTYRLTNLGHDLVEHIGLVAMLFEGYGELMLARSRSGPYALNAPDQYIDGEAIAKSSVLFGQDTVDPLIISMLQTFKPKGMLCDLGCGSAARLAKICKVCGIAGIGFDSNQDALNSGNAITRGLSISTSLADITRLTGVWEDVEILMQCFVMHDIPSSAALVGILQQYRECFPNMSKFIYVDIVSPSIKAQQPMPGFDYVHGMQGFTPRNYEQTIEAFKIAGYTIETELQVNDLPNAFLWVLG